MILKASTNGSVTNAVTQPFIPPFCIPLDPLYSLQHFELQNHPFVPFLETHTDKYGHFNGFLQLRHFIFAVPFSFLVPLFQSQEKKEGAISPVFLALCAQGKPNRQVVRTTSILLRLKKQFWRY